jgi:hypothetical protein
MTVMRKKCLIFTAFCKCSRVLMTLKGAWDLTSYHHWRYSVKSVTKVLGKEKYCKVYEVNVEYSTKGRTVKDKLLQVRCIWKLQVEKKD